MYAGMSIQMLMLVAALGLMAGFIVGHAMHGVMGDQGFGPFGNTLVLASGFVLGISGLEKLGLSPPVDMLTAYAISAAFAVLFVTAVFKRFVLRI